MRPVIAVRLSIRLTLHFAALIRGVLAVAPHQLSALRLLPVGGTDALEVAWAGASGETETTAATLGATDAVTGMPAAARQRGLMVLFLAVSLLLTTIVMSSITWACKATRRDTGYRKTFVCALIVLPVCAPTIVLLIQNGLSLAFWLAALVAAVRFRVPFQNPVDGISDFKAICVTLAVGIGYRGIAAVMAKFFCFASTMLWRIDLGSPLDEVRATKDSAKLEPP
jgi:hypothetical protein